MRITLRLGHDEETGDVIESPEMGFCAAMFTSSLMDAWEESAAERGQRIVWYRTVDGFEASREPLPAAPEPAQRRRWWRRG